MFIVFILLIILMLIPALLVINPPTVWLRWILGLKEKTKHDPE